MEACSCSYNFFVLNAENGFTHWFPLIIYTLNLIRSLCSTHICVMVCVYTTKMCKHDSLILKKKWILMHINEIKSWSTFLISFHCYYRSVFPAAWCDSGGWDPVPGFPAPPRVRQQCCMKAVGNRNTMAATLSLTQVTLSYNSNITAANEPGPLPVLPGDACVVLV